MNNSTHSIFYSWQSDLPETDNKSYIGYCLSKALTKLKKEVEYSVEYVIERATNNRIGTIDIAQTIFNKINNAKLFIADVSIINYRSKKYKKAPNPNILIELGYAVRTIGWENIICIFNTKYGKPENLPFDIRNRRLLLFNSDNDKSILIDNLYYIIKENHKTQVPSDIIRDYYNAKIYTSLFGLVSDCYKVFFGYNNGITTNGINQVLNLNKKEIIQKLNNQTFLGFQIFKSYPSVIKDLENLLDKILAIRQYNDNYYVPLVHIIDILKLHDKFLNRKMDVKKMEYVSNNENSDYIILNNKSTESLPYRFILSHKIKGKKGLSIVIDSGDIIKIDFQKSLLHTFRLTVDNISFYLNFYIKLMSAINKWIDNNGGEFILDNTELEFHSPNI